MSAPSISKTEEAALPVIAAGDDANAGSTQSADDAESGPQANMPALVTEHSGRFASRSTPQGSLLSVS